MVDLRAVLIEHMVPQIIPRALEYFMDPPEWDDDDDDDESDSDESEDSDDDSDNDDSD